ncbi:SDR family NAD(P)-dependent oxidoreductase [Brevibacterium oceani]|uniref:SDR family NAD(P)-dependent oxidoreductase n=1 Tax=Brevibacterium oceani TaxID=358099 RepID=UPI0015E7C0D2|nr:SDR family oxidoreductase [Brevibacterium oceani]
MSVVLITGSSSGIGRATAERLADSGHAIVIHGLDNTETAAVERSLRSKGASVASVCGDVAETSTINSLLDAVQSLPGQLSGVVSNAGAGLTKEFEKIDDEGWLRLFETHLLAAARLCRATSAPLAESKGAVVITSSVAARLAVPERVGYGAVKAGIEGLVRGLASEWGPRGVRVNAVSPGTIVTPLVQRNFDTGLLDPSGVLERTPLGRFGEPQEVASTIEFLLSTDASYVTGQTIAVDGGWSAWGGWS